MPTITAGALKHMLGLPANVVAGTPRIERDPPGGQIVIVLMRPYVKVKDPNQCTKCGWSGRIHDRLPMQRWRHLDIGCARLLAGACVRPRQLRVARRNGRDGTVGEEEGRVHA